MRNILVLELDALPPAEFAVNRSSGHSFWVKDKAKKAAIQMMGVALNQAGWDRNQPPMQRARVSIHFYFPPALNMTLAGCKSA